MRLTELDPHWVGAGGEGVTHNGAPVAERHGVGISFDCPCGCDSRGFIGFANPLDGGPPYDPRPNALWQRTGDTFDTLTLSPSIQRHKVGDHGCEWHGYIGLSTPGEVTTC